MEGLLKSDIFFFITSAVVIAIGVGLVIVFYYLINILRDVKDVSKTVKNETKEFVQDLSQLRVGVKKGRVFSSFFSFFRSIFVKSKKGRK